MKSLFKKPIGFSLVVKNVDQDVRTWADVYGIGPWKIFNYDTNNVAELLVDEKQANECALVAVCDIGGREVKLIQPTTGDSVFARFLDRHGEGIFSVTYEPTDYDETLSYIKQKGDKFLIQGSINGKDFCLIDSYKDAWHYIEFGRTPLEYPSERMYPVDGNAPDTPPLFTGIFQIAFAITDMESAVKKMADNYGLGPFECCNLSEDVLDDRIADGKPAQYTLQCGMAHYDDLEFELISPLPDKDPTLYNSFLAEHGDGLNHIGYSVSDYQKTVDFLASDRGCEVLLQGKVCKLHTYIYLDTTADIKNIVELNLTIQPPKIPPFLVYPEK